MTTITFNTVELIDRLRSAGFQDAQAEAIIRVLADARNDLVTNEHLESTLNKALAPLKTKLAVLEWKTNALLVCNLVIITLLIKIAF